MRQYKYRLIVRDVGIGVAILGAVITIGQIVYPKDKLLPLVSVQGYSLGIRSTNDAKAALTNHYKQATLTLHGGDKTETASFAEIGIDIDEDTAIAKAVRYPWYQRIIPFSSLAVMIARDVPLSASYDTERLDYFATQTAQKLFNPAVNATVSVSNGKAMLVSAKPSREYTKESVAAAIKSATYVPKTSTIPTAIVKPAARTDDQVRVVLSEAQKAAGLSLTLELSGEKITVSKSTLSSWLEVAEVEGLLRLGLKTDVVKTYLADIQVKVYKAPGTTAVELLDGVEVSRSVGQTGRGIDMDQAIASLQKALQGPESQQITLSVVELVPQVTYDRKRSNTSAGLSILLSDILKARGNYALAVLDLTGDRDASVNGNKQFTSASTYKLFVAYAVFKEIEAGNMSWSDTINGKTVSKCFEDMIVVSDNNCAKAFGESIGWNVIDTMMDGLGLTNTQVQGGNHLTTANDLARFLYKLETGSLLSSADRTKLIDLMKRQIYRSGIPAGTGVTTADKVGFLDALLHDAAIVYGPKPYVLVVLSDGSSWSQVADAAKQIQAFMGQ
jgi:beta-lactamase class A